MAYDDALRRTGGPRREADERCAVCWRLQLQMRTHVLSGQVLHAAPVCALSDDITLPGLLSVRSRTYHNAAVAAEDGEENAQEVCINKDKAGSNTFQGRLCLWDAPAQIDWYCHCATRCDCQEGLREHDNTLLMASEVQGQSCDVSELRQLERAAYPKDSARMVARRACLEEGISPLCYEANAVTKPDAMCLSEGFAEGCNLQGHHLCAAFMFQTHREGFVWRAGCPLC